MNLLPHFTFKLVAMFCAGNYCSREYYCLTNRWTNMSSQKHLIWSFLHRTSCVKELFTSYPNKKFLRLCFLLMGLENEYFDWIYCINFWSIKRIEQDRKIAIYIIISNVYQLDTLTQHKLEKLLRDIISLFFFEMFVLSSDSYIHLRFEEIYDPTFYNLEFMYTSLDAAFKEMTMNISAYNKFPIKFPMFRL